MRTFIARIVARIVVSKIRRAVSTPSATQEKVFRGILKKAARTAFAKEHGLDPGLNHAEYARKVPIRDYEQQRQWFERIKKGEADVLWPGRPLYLAKTSGTTSGAKYIPISRDSISNHIQGARNALLFYIAETGKADFTSGKMIFLQGSPVLEKLHGISTGRLSGIVAHHVPAYLRKNRMPSFEVNCIEDWETKVDAIARETVSENMTLISGIPPWVQMYFEKLREISGKQTIREIFPNFSLFVYGGVNFEPYRQQMEAIIGSKIDSIEVFPASEGFIAYQDKQNDRGLLLQLDQGIFYEFVPVDEATKEFPKRLTIGEVQLDKQYLLVLTTNAGLWSYNLGDTIKFVSLDPPRIVVTGRLKHYTSAFGEHVIAEEVEQSLLATLERHSAKVVEFHIAPQVHPGENKLPYHEWLIAFETLPADLEKFARALDEALQERNIYYRDLVNGKVLRPLIITPLPADAFIRFMKSQGKLGGQNKVPRLANDRRIADQLLQAEA